MGRGLSGVSGCLIGGAAQAAVAKMSGMSSRRFMVAVWGGEKGAIMPLLRGAWLDLHHQAA